MKSTRTLKATGLVLIAVVLALLTVQGSYALWNTAANANAGTVTAADFQVSLTDTITTTSTNMTLANGTAATLALSTTPVGVVIPGQSTYAGVQLGNDTNAGGDFTVQAITGTPVISNSAGSALAPHLSIKVVAATSLQQCSTPALYATATSSAPATMELAKSAKGVFCFQVTLAATMPANLSGQSAAVAIPITVNQV
ncbi:hypothetical protein SAMN04489740_1998 [Arthrobacter alpinus]|uniref:SipW-cognate class signal peptide n=1 Tax=Arthrobacter alpinus TaxID=656366 RepID=A0A1H5KG60_9MICC|nr:hypothetical protein [Arthrobacter alpinus]SEE63755.1 hypothetical protein SAMN04489740_1998 [Arthrobacter alpinus]